MGWLVVIGSKVLSIVSGMLATVMLSYSGYVIYDSLYTERAAYSSWDLSQYRPVLEEEGDLSFEELIDINPDTVGWITIQGTNMDYPVVQGEDDLEYASKDVFGNSSLTGSIYLTTANTRDFTNSFNLIYGHHMANGAMFGDIEKYADMKYFYNHQNGILITTQGVYDLHVFARIGADAYDSRIYSAGDRKSSDFPDFLEYVKSLSIQWDETTDIYDITDRVRTYLIAREQNIAENGEFVFKKMPRDAVENGMQLLALSTCADATTNGRQLLFATMKIRTEPLPVEVIKDEAVPLAVFGHGQSEYWSLVNLLCVLVVLYTVVPLFHTKQKYERNRLLQEMRETNVIHVGNKRMSYRHQKKLLGLIIEIIIAVMAVGVFLYTEDLKTPLTVIDKYTPLMIVFVAVITAIDILLFRDDKEANNKIFAPLKEA